MAALRLALLALVLAPLAACDSGRDDVSRGTFEAEITGGLSVDLEGDAYFREVDGGSGEPAIFTLTMLDASPDVRFRSLSVSDVVGELSGVGTYALGFEDEPRSVGLVYLEQRGNTSSTLVALSGTLEVTRFETDRISGSFSATLGTFSGSASAEAAGSFDAVPLEPSSL